MKKKFLKFVKDNWVKSEYASANWDSDEKAGFVEFYDGNCLVFEYVDGEFLQIEA